MFTRRGMRKALVPSLLSLVVVGGFALPANALPPGIPSASAAQSELAGLTVAANGSMDGYSRDEFPTWITIEGNCNTREYVLQRDADSVTEGNDCYPTSGSWTSPYNGATITDPSKVQIDHIVPLGDAWASGAASWTTAQRQAFANDVKDPQLLGVDASDNESKGDRSPDQWKPPSQAFWCTYAEMYTQIKSDYSLTVTSAEHDALADMLGTC
jgi:hypothetical protein